MADAALWNLEVVEAASLTPSIHRVVVTAPGIEDLKHDPGQDLMLRIPLDGDRVVNRRYTIRRFDPDQRTVTIDVSLHGAGPGTDWIRAAKAGDGVAAIGPRGKITVDAAADWHLFVADETGLPGVLAMIEALPSGAFAIALLEVDTTADEQEPVGGEAEHVDLHWLHRLGASVPGDPGPLLDAIGSVELPPGTGRAYLAAEARVVREVSRRLVEKGLAPGQISSKAYWRRGLPNAEHGEPAREE